MAVSLCKARDFIYANGTLWERALFDYLFEEGPLERVHACLLPYKNMDTGFGHGLERDITCPYSNPLQLEFLLSLHRDTGLPVKELLNGTVAWLEAIRAEDGSLTNPLTLLDYPLAPWWRDWGRQKAPDSITGHLIKLGLCTPSLAESTKRWALKHLTLEKVKANDWLFMAYHAHDYSMNVQDFPELERYREATLQNIVDLAVKAPKHQWFVLFQFANAPDSPVAKAVPENIITRNLDYLVGAQREDGGWDDEHGLIGWQPYMSMVVLLALKRYGYL